MSSRTSDKAIFEAIADVFAARQPGKALVMLGPATKTASLRWFVVWLGARRSWDFARVSAAMAKRFPKLAAVSDTSEHPSGGTTFDWFVGGKLKLGLGRERVTAGSLSKTYRCGGRLQSSLDVGLAEIGGGSARGPWRAVMSKRIIDVVSRELVSGSPRDDGRWSALPREWDGIFLDGDEGPFVFEDYEASGEPEPQPLVSPVAAREPTLEARIVAAPDDPKPYLAYAEWLRAHGDPRGELIVLQHAGEKAKAKATALLNRAPAYFGSHPDTNPIWRWGYFEHLSIHCRSVASVEEALAHPSAQFLRGLTLHEEHGDVEFALEILAKRSWPTLSRLCLSAYRQLPGSWSAIRWTNATRRLVEKAAPNLARLRLEAETVDVDARLTSRPLTEICVATTTLRSKGSVDSLLPDCSRLERLELFGLDEPSAKAKDIDVLFEASKLPSVVRLGLGSSALADRLAGALARSSIAPQLKWLDLQGGTMTAVGALALASSASRFSTLEVLNLTENTIDEASAERVRAAFAGRGTTVHIGMPKSHARVSRAIVP